MDGNDRNLLTRKEIATFFRSLLGEALSAHPDRRTSCRLSASTQRYEL